MKDQKKIRLGLIGVGKWALFRTFPGAEAPTAVRDRKLSTTNARKRRWRPLKSMAFLT